MGEAGIHLTGWGSQRRQLPHKILIKDLLIWICWLKDKMMVWGHSHLCLCGKIVLNTVFLFAADCKWIGGSADNWQSVSSHRLCHWNCHCHCHCFRLCLCHCLFGKLVLKAFANGLGGPQIIDRASLESHSVEKMWQKAAFLEICTETRKFIKIPKIAGELQNSPISQLSQLWVFVCDSICLLQRLSPIRQNCCLPIHEKGE